MASDSTTSTTVGAAERAISDARLRERAARVVPGGMYGHLDAKELPDGFPQFFVRGEGCRVWDVDGHEYVDFMCSWGPIVLGHNHPEVEAAVAAEAERGVCLDGPSPRMVELAELLVETVAHADWAMFCKNGTDATTLGVVIARAATGRRKVLMARGAYHGIAAWSARPGTPGITPEDSANTIFFDYNDLDSLDAAIVEAGDDVAAIAVTPIRHELRNDLELADPRFAVGVRERCDRLGAALLIDEVRCGLRMDLRGSWEPLGVRPDLSAFSKALANGHPLATLVGSEPLREAAQKVVATGSFWFAGPPMAAALATIRFTRETGAIEAMRRAGERFRAGLAAQARAHGLEVALSGPPQLPFMSFAGDSDFQKAFAWAAACAERGAYIHPFHNWFISAAHDDASIDAALAATDGAFAAVRERFGAD